MILHLLQQSGIEGRIDGEHLLGAMGELPVMGLVRVVVDDGDVRRAKEVIADWESHQREDFPKESPSSRLDVGSILLGVVIGAILTSATFCSMQHPAASELSSANGPDRGQLSF